MNHVRLALVAFAFAALSCQSHPKPPPAVNPSLAGAMQGISHEVRDLLPFLYNAQAFQDPANAPRIKADLKNLKTRAHSVTPEMQASVGLDPLETYSLEGMQVDLSRSIEAFDQGRTDYARSAAKAATTHCFRCHSVSKEGSRAHWDLSQFSNLELKPIEKVDLLVALRRYDEAGKYLEARLNDQSYFRQAPYEFDTLLRKYFSLMIRVENDPQRPLKELEAMIKEGRLPAYVGEQALAWRTSLREWGKSKAPKGKNLIAQANERLKRGRQLQQFPKDHSGDIEFLRATRLLHDFLRTQPAPLKRAEAYMALGQAYEVLDELGYWNLHEVYYESCVRAVPKTELARRCYGRFEASIYLGFSGSSGVHIPEPERERLKTLKELTL